MEESPHLKRDGEEDDFGLSPKKPRLQGDDSTSDSVPIEKFQESDIITIKEESLSAEENTDGDTGLIGLREADVGIVEYVNEEEGFQGVLKQRFQDFVVNEQSKSGDVVRLLNLEPPENDIETSPPVQSSSSPVITSTDIEKLNGLIESNDRSNSVNIMTPFTPMVRNIRRRVCARCQARFTSKSALRRHMAEQHEGRVRLVCLFCDRAFSRKYDLKRHLQDKHTATEQITELTNNISPTSTSPSKNNQPTLQSPHLVGTNPKLPIARSNERPYPTVQQQQQQSHVPSMRPSLAQPASSTTGRVNTMHHHPRMNMNGPPTLRLPHVNSPPSSVMQQRSPTNNQVRLLIPPSVNNISQPHPTTSTQHRRIQPSVLPSQQGIQRPQQSHTVVQAVQRSNEPQVKSMTTSAMQTELPPKSEVQPVPRRPARRLVSETTTTELLDEGVVVARVTKTRNYEI